MSEEHDIVQDGGNLQGQGDTVDINFSEQHTHTDERPQYGGDDGRKYNAQTVVGYDEYVDGSNGVERVFHNTESISPTSTVSKSNGVGLGAGAIFQDPEGRAIPARNTSGSIWLAMVPVESIVYPGDETNQARKGSLNVYGLENMIDHVGLITPIHVVPFGTPIGYEQDEEGHDIESLPLYSKYYLFHGKRRYESMVNLGDGSVLALIDTTIPSQLIQVYQAFAQYSEPYTFSEKMAYIKSMRVKQPEMSSDLIENALGYRTGELAKAEYIESMKVDFTDIYNKVDSHKFTVEQGFKAIEREQSKAEKEREKAEQGGDSQDDEDRLRGKQGDDLEELSIAVKQQELGDRKILDAPTRRAVEARDGAKCQCCGYGDKIPDLASMFSVHHMVAVQYGGSDSPDNLILLCQNCHKMVHDYEIGRIALSKDTFNKYEDIKRVVVLGNVLRKSRTTAIKAVRDQDPALGRRMDKGIITVGKALQKGKINLKLEESYPSGSPYQAFMSATSKLKYGGRLEGELADFEDALVEGEELKDEDLTLEDLLIDSEIEEELEGKAFSDVVSRNVIDESSLGSDDSNHTVGITLEDLSI